MNEYDIEQNNEQINEQSIADGSEEIMTDDECRSSLEVIRMENEYETATPPAAQPQTDGSRYYTETIKGKKKKKNGFVKFVAVAVICAVVAAPLLGLGMGAGQMLVTSWLNGGTLSVSQPASPASPLAAIEAKDTGENFTVSSVAKIEGAATLAGVIKSAESSVVNITTSIVNTNQFYNFYFGRSQQEAEGSGTGIIFKQDEQNVYIMTNYHVIQDASKAYISFTDNEQIQASPVGANKNEDVAVISVKKSDLAAEGITSVSVATMGNSSMLEVGEWVVAIGNALGNGKTATFGIVSALNKEVALQSSGSTVKKPVNLIQTDASINPGNSGGALVNMSGEVVGMNTAKLAGYTVEGMGFALPINSIMGIVNEIMGNKAESKPFIGISGATIDAALVEEYSLIVSEGVLLSEVFENGGASDAGLRAGDIITEFGGRKITTVEELQSAVSENEIGSRINAIIIRNNQREIEVTIEITNITDVNPW